jgi:hypothetical protein
MPERTADEKKKPYENKSKEEILQHLNRENRKHATSERQMAQEPHDEIEESGNFVGDGNWASRGKEVEGLGLSGMEQAKQLVEKEVLDDEEGIESSEDGELSKPANALEVQRSLPTEQPEQMIRKEASKDIGEYISASEDGEPPAQANTLGNLGVHRTEHSQQARVTSDDTESWIYSLEDVKAPVQANTPKEPSNRLSKRPHKQTHLLHHNDHRVHASPFDQALVSPISTLNDRHQLSPDLVSTPDSPRSPSLQSEQERSITSSYLYPDPPVNVIPPTHPHTLAVRIKVLRIRSLLMTCQAIACKAEQVEREERRYKRGDTALFHVYSKANKYAEDAHFLAKEVGSEGLGARSWYWIGWAALRRERWTDAVEAFERAVELDDKGRKEEDVDENNEDKGNGGKKGRETTKRKGDRFPGLRPAERERLGNLLANARRRVIAHEEDDLRTTGKNRSLMDEFADIGMDEGEDSALSDEDEDLTDGSVASSWASMMYFE